MLPEVVFRLVAVTHFPSQGVHLTTLEAVEPEGAPPFGGPDHGAEHEVEHRLLDEGACDYVEINIIWSNFV